MTRSTTPSLGEVLRAAIQESLAGVHVSLPARVEEYDASQQRASVRPLLKRGYLNERGEREVEELPVITDVPVMFLGAGGFRITFPVQNGDTVLLVFSEQSLDRWLHDGGVVDPADDRRHNLTDAIAIPGLRSFSDAWNAPAGVMSVGKDGGASASFDDDEIRLGSDDASDPVSLHSDLQELADKLAEWVVVPMDGGAALKSLLTSLIATGWPFGATKVKVE